MVMGDMNDDPDNTSMSKWLGAKRKMKEVGEHDFYNPWWDVLRSNGQGTLTYKGAWNLFDQIVLSRNLLDVKGKKDYRQSACQTDGMSSYWPTQAIVRRRKGLQEGGLQANPCSRTALQILPTSLPVLRRRLFAARNNRQSTGTAGTAPDTIRHADSSYTKTKRRRCPGASTSLLECISVVVSLSLCHTAAKLQTISEKSRCFMRFRWIAC